MDYKFLAQIIDKNWFQRVPKGKRRDWTFRADIETLSAEQMERLLLLLFESLEVKIENSELVTTAECIKSGKACVVKGQRIDTEFLSKFLVCITLSEYRIDSLLYHPPKMRFRELNEIILSVGLPAKTVKNIYVNWHAGIRKKVFERS